ncbi:MAG TPA: ABC transporter substrate-binding protein [Actinomycetota bacterium]|jgi:iron complex transport system substrate-binding protein|nr:ABC transporter substrate-binding protein [Actinomycetota bacterium]
MGRRLVLLVVSVAVVAAACASDGEADVESTRPSAGAAFPVTVTTANGDVTIDERPERIISLSPTATEMLFAIGADDQVIAVDDQSNFPAGAPTTELSGFEPNVEAIASYEPDLVVYSTEPGDLGSTLEGLGITTMLQPAATKLDDAYEQIEQLGRATGNAEAATSVVDDMRTEVDSIVSSVEMPQPPLTFYHELDDTYYSVTSHTFIGQLYGLVGLENIADAAAGGGGYPQLSAEYVIRADPDLIFLADTKCCGQSPATVAERPGWSSITAVRRRDVVPLDDDVASRWGPRIVEYLRTIADAVSDVEAEAA